MPKLVVRQAGNAEADMDADALFPTPAAGAEPHCKLVAFPGISDPEKLSHSAAFSGATDYALVRVGRVAPPHP